MDNSQVIDLTDDGDGVKLHQSEPNNPLLPSFPFYLLSTQASNEDYELTLNDILCGNIRSILLMNYMYDFNWLLKYCSLLQVQVII